MKTIRLTVNEINNYKITVQLSDDDFEDIKKMSCDELSDYIGDFIVRETPSLSYFENGEFEILE